MNYIDPLKAIEIIESYIEKYATPRGYTITYTLRDHTPALGRCTVISKKDKKFHLAVNLDNLKRAADPIKHVRMTTLHEIAHVIAWGMDGRRAHGKNWKTVCGNLFFYEGIDESPRARTVIGESKDSIIKSSEYLMVEFDGSGTIVDLVKTFKRKPSKYIGAHYIPSSGNRVAYMPSHLVKIGNKLRGDFYGKMK